MVNFQTERSEAMKIVVTSVYVDNQDKALNFYTKMLGFVKKTDIPLGGEHRWLTVVSPDSPNGTELLLEPDAHPAVGPFKRALVKDGIPLTSFGVDVHAEYKRLQVAGVRFTQPPVEMGPVTTAVLDDTCGNLIQIAAKKK
jgi:catechol 2,3-dioxygenase-like lactoylglutathione lyase family enzyme